MPIPPIDTDEHTWGELKSTWQDSDPSTTVPVGGDILFVASCVRTAGIPRLATWFTDTSCGLDGVLLVVQFSNGGSVSSEGSAVMIGPGVALCARQVVEPHLDKIATGSTVMPAIGLLTEEGVLQHWSATRGTAIARSDLCILSLELASPLSDARPIRLARISTRSPRVGELLTMFGFRSLSGAVARGGVLQGGVIACKGPVAKVWTGGRDRVLLPSPVLEVDCPAFGGMSGGPVFDEWGYLVGLVSSSIDDGGQGGPTYVSMLYPAMNHPFSGGWPEGLIKGQTTLLEMESCPIAGRDFLTIERDPASGTVAYHVQEWDFASEGSGSSHESHAPVVGVARRNHSS